MKELPQAVTVVLTINVGVLIALLIRSFQLGRLFQRFLAVEELAHQVPDLKTKVDRIAIKCGLRHNEAESGAD